MTRARALKKIIRARIAKTGERYTTARRHIITLVPKRPGGASAASATPPSVKPSTKGSVSDAGTRKRTGHGLDHWFAVLDAFGGIAKGHTASAGHLSKAHGVDAWYAQGITVAYERARGVRAVNQRRDGEYAVSVSKVVAASTRDIVRAFADAGERGRWMDEVDVGLAGALSSALSARTSKGFTVRPDGQAHCRFKWDQTAVEVQLLPRPKGKVSVSITNSRLPSAAAVEERRTKWRTALGALAAFLSA